ncbi:MAG: beta-propeller domain-containing protein [Oligoflexia bacterium]|nr:beta-propeller domain-containing protein [Oligoflexia bacterium]
MLRYGLVALVAAGALSCSRIQEICPNAPETYVSASLSFLPEPEPPVLDPQKGCAQLQDWFSRSALPELGAGPVPPSSPRCTFASPASPPTLAAENSPRFTDTNNQIPGVEEPDFYKTDGQLLFKIAGSSLQILRIWPKSQAGLLASLAIESNASRLLLDSERNELIVIGKPRSREYAFQIDVYDVSKPEAPALKLRKLSSGAIIEARRIGRALEIVANNPIWSQDRSLDLSDSCELALLPGADTYGISRISTLNLDSGNLSEVAFLGTFYRARFSKTSVYLIQDNRVHRFDLAGTDRPRFIASGEFEGPPHWSPFAFDEKDGQLRIATQKKVLVMGLNGRTLEVLGSTPELAPGETVYASRFLDDRAYVVTFRQTDPLFIIDLADATRPRVTGELKVPGYSTYLHPISGERLLAIGRDTGVKVSLYDVADPARPKELSTFSTGKSASEAEYNHLAFTFSSWASTLAVPYSNGSWDLIDVSAEGGLRKLAEIPGDPTPPLTGWMRGTFIHDSLLLLSDVQVRGIDTRDPQQPPLIISLPKD